MAAKNNFIIVFHFAKFRKILAFFKGRTSIIL